MIIFHYYLYLLALSFIDADDNYVDSDGKHRIRYSF